MSGAFGLVEWFRPGDELRVERMLPQMRATGAQYLRTHLSWADYVTPGGEAWFDWLLPRLSAQFEVLPCVHYTPPSLSRTGASNGAPRVLKDYADFIDHVLTRHGRHFRHVELWNEPNNLLDWDWREDPEFDLFCEMVGGAAYWVRQRGWNAVLGGPCPFDPLWLQMMGDRGVLAEVSAVGLHGFPGTWDSDAASWNGWVRHLAQMRETVSRYNRDAEIWITETGYSTWQHHEAEQARRFCDALAAPADRMYWYGWRDLPADVPVQEGLWFDPRHYHMGMADTSGQPKLLARLLADGGPANVRDVLRLAAPAPHKPAQPVVVTGGAGFIGCNLADSLLAEGKDVIILDNLSRAGVEDNLAWLRDRHGARVHPAICDLRDARGVAGVLSDAAQVYHLAGQTAVTTSLAHPVDDFEVNARGTLNVLEALRMNRSRVPLVFASTNKVYGALADLGMDLVEGRYLPQDPSIRAHGVDETRPLQFCTPYGCSKGVADQYILDYAASFGLPAAVLRMSCIYGPRQFGTEDQGWVAHFLIRALRGEPISVYGDGLQVRDVLHVSDAVAAYRGVMARMDDVQGRAFNLGGGPGNAVSLLAVLTEIDRITGTKSDISFGDWRQGDQPYFVADTRALQHATGWQPTVAWQDGLWQLAGWLSEHRCPLPAGKVTAR